MTFNLPYHYHFVVLFCVRLADLIGYGDELKQLVADGHRELDEKLQRSGGVGVGALLPDTTTTESGSVSTSA